MEKKIERLKYHKDDRETPQTTFRYHIKEWNLKFLRIDVATLFDLLTAASYLEIKGLLDLTTTYVAKRIADAGTPENIRKRFNTENDLTPEDLEQIMVNAERWCSANDDGDETDGATGGAVREQEMEVEGEEEVEEEEIEDDSCEPMPSHPRRHLL